MKQVVSSGVLAALLACQMNPYTGRSQLILIDEATERALGIQAYQQVLSESAVSSNPEYVNPVRAIGQNLAAVADRPDFRWEFNVIENDKTLNAFCLPGGKIAIYTGIFPVADNEAGLAIILGHEIIHALARHGAERMSQSMAAELGSVLLGAALGSAKKETQTYAMAAYGLGVHVGLLLPYSRNHESEADKLGLMLAARAGYDPREGPQVWRRMNQLAGSGGPEFLSTHPSHETRISDMEKWMPEAMKLYEASVKRPNRKLPAIGKPRSSAPEIAGPRGQGRSERRRTKEGFDAVQFEFVFSEDIWLSKISVDVPGQGKVDLKADTSVQGNLSKSFVIWSKSRDTRLPSGAYKATFQGKQSGQPFTSMILYDVR